MLRAVGKTDLWIVRKCVLSDDAQEQSGKSNGMEVLQLSAAWQTGW